MLFPQQNDLSVTLSEENTTCLSVVLLWAGQVFCVSCKIVSVCHDKLLFRVVVTSD